MMLDELHLPRASDSLPGVVPQLIVAIRECGVVE